MTRNAQGPGHAAAVPFPVPVPMLQLPYMCNCMQVLVGLHECGQAQLEPVLAALSTGTQLTGLQLYVRDSTQEEDRPGVGE